MWKNAIQYSNELRLISVTSATELTTFYLENKSRALIDWLSLWRRQRDAMTTVAVTLWKNHHLARQSVSFKGT